MENSMEVGSLLFNDTSYNIYSWFINIALMAKDTVIHPWTILT